MRALRDVKALRISEWERMVRASCRLGSDDEVDSHAATLRSDKDPSRDMGGDIQREDISEANRECA